MPRSAARLEALREALAGRQLAGAGCGYVPPEQHKPRPRIIREFLRRLGDFYGDPARLGFLGRCRGRERMMYKQRRAACLALMGAITHYLDLVTLRVGIPLSSDPQRMQGVDLPHLAALAGLPLRRAERAYSDLCASGILTTHPIAHQQDDGSHVGRPAIRTVFGGVFEAIGLSAWLKKARKRLSDKRREPKAAAPDTRDRGRQRMNWEAAKRAAGLQPSIRTTGLDPPDTG